MQTKTCIIRCAKGVFFMMYEVDYINTRIGIIKIKAKDGFLIECGFVDEKTESANSSEFTKLVKQQLLEYFAGKRIDFDIPFQLEGTDFQKAVWNTLIKIPYGRTISYKDVAERVGSPKAFRAVGNANNKNKIGIIIPCHRVIGSDSKLVGYASGVVRKQALLEHERDVLDNI